MYISLWAVKNVITYVTDIAFVKLQKYVFNVYNYLMSSRPLLASLALAQDGKLEQNRALSVERDTGPSIVGNWMDVFR